MRKWQVDTTTYTKRRNELVRMVLGRVPVITAEEMVARSDYRTVVNNLDFYINQISNINHVDRYKERTPLSYRQRVKKLEECLNEVEQLATIYLLTFSGE